MKILQLSYIRKKKVLFSRYELESFIKKKKKKVVNYYFIITKENTKVSSWF